ncbi:hypothetical protein AB0C34_17600 [Nocardia sp. NPDC049220]|uniref:hypothetical protein n=1 Tax=Nocardia sp. NPDC049220 TaxID=3155273 RepID=UPI00340F7A5E
MNDMAVSGGGVFVAPRRAVGTLQRAGCEVYADTGGPVDKRLGSHIVLLIVDDADVWAAAIEAEGDAQFAWWRSKGDLLMGERRRSRKYESAACVRAEGACRSWYRNCDSADVAFACVVDLRRAHPNPGVRYEVVPITGAGTCPECHRPMIEADGQWRHHLGNSIDCVHRQEPATDAADHVEGEWVIDVDMGTMICGYCNEVVGWAEAVSHVRLTGGYLFGIEAGNLIVLAEAALPDDRITYLPHYCDKIPDQARARWTPIPAGAS